MSSNAQSDKYEEKIKTEISSSKSVEFIRTYWPPQNDQEKALLLHIQQYIEERLRKADSIAFLTTNEEAKKIITFLKENSLFGVQDKEGIRVFHNVSEKKYENQLVLTVIFPGDPLIFKRWKRIVVEEGNGLYDAYTKCLILKDDDSLSDLTKTFTLLHEGRHAKQDQENKLEGDYLDIYLHAKEEYETYEFELSIAEALGGERYLNLLDLEIRNIRDSTTEAGGKIGFFFPVKCWNCSGLDEVFGLAFSSYEKISRQSVFLIHAHFKLIDREFGEKSKEQKIYFISKIFF